MWYNIEVNEEEFFRTNLNSLKKEVDIICCLGKLKNNCKYRFGGKNGEN